MNAHFDADPDSRRNWPRVPRHAFGRIDYSEQINDEKIIVGIDVIDADSFHDSEWVFQDANFYWHQFFENSDDLSEWGAMEEAFDQARIYHIEIEQPKNKLKKWFTQKMLDDQSSEWRLFHLSEAHSNNTVNAVNVYNGLFAEPVPAMLWNVTRVNRDTAYALNAAFSMKYWPCKPSSKIKNVLGNVDASFLAAYDVGQGLATGLLSESCLPTMFYDIGCGVYRNARTRPAGFSLCHCTSAPIVLSHWDADHWAGAVYSSHKGMSNPYLKRTWIAPYDSRLGVKNSAFAFDILKSGGKLLIWKHRTSLPLGPIRLKNGSELTLLRGTGTDRNSSGIAAVVRHSSERDLKWLLTGDIDYQYLGTYSAQSFIAMTVPHHGSKISTSIPMPHHSLSQNPYRRLIYSFGPGNGFGHPTNDCIKKHHASGWNHGHWSPSLTATNVPGQDVLSSAHHLPSNRHLDSMIIGWDSIPTPVGLPCPKTCSAALNQS